LIDGEGNAKLADFGFAKYLCGHSSTSTFCGTPAYMAPETIKDQPQTQAVDWWSCGGVLYFMIKGVPIFTGANPNEIFQRVLNFEPSSHKWPIDIQGPLLELISGLLMPNHIMRLGGAGGLFGGKEVKRQRWFTGVDWNQAYSNAKQSPEIYEEDSVITKTKAKLDRESASKKNRRTVETTDEIGKRILNAEKENMYTKFEDCFAGF
jgi:serine/threonine protein kinase